MRRPEFKPHLSVSSWCQASCNFAKHPSFFNGSLLTKYDVFPNLFIFIDKKHVRNYDVVKMK